MEKTDMLHACLMDLVLEVQRICEIHRITFFLIGGTLLGSVRHQGIIPWDDDIDVGMLRADYERFLKVCPTELKRTFRLIVPENIDNYGLPYSKIQINGTVFNEPYNPKDFKGRVFIDIFPIDRIPDSKLARKFHAIVLQTFKATLYRKCKYSTTAVGLKDKCCKGLAKVLTRRMILRIYQYFLTCHNKKKSQFYANLCGSYAYGREVFPVKSLEGILPTVPFEGYLLPVPKDADTILKILYGDYMTPPPVENRVFRHSNDLDFGNYVPVAVIDRSSQDALRKDESV